MFPDIKNASWVGAWLIRVSCRMDPVHGAMIDTVFVIGSLPIFKSLKWRNPKCREVYVLNHLAQTGTSNTLYGIHWTALGTRFNILYFVACL